MLLVIDEVSRFLSQVLRFRSDLGPPILQDQAQSMRKRDLFLVAGTQSVSELAPGALINFATRIVFRTPEPINLRQLSDVLSLSADQRLHVASLKDRRAVLFFPFWPKAFVIEVPELAWCKADPERVAAAMEPVLSGLSWVPVSEPVAASDAQVNRGTHAKSDGTGSMLSHAEVGYLIAIARYPFLPATERDRKSSIALGTGAAMRKRLAEGGYIMLHKQRPPGRGGEITLTELTEKAWNALRERKVSGVSKPAGIGGFEHTRHQAAIRDWIMRQFPGASARIEAALDGKRIDVLAEFNDGRVEAFEVVMNGEQWASQVKELRNIVRDLEVAGVSKVHVCGEDEQTLSRIKEHLLRECGQDFIGKHQGEVQWRLLSEFLK